MLSSGKDDLEILWEKQRQHLEQLCDKRKRMDATITQTYSPRRDRDDGFDHDRNRVHCMDSFLRVFVERLSFVFELLTEDDEALQTMTCLHSCVVSVGRRLRQMTIDDERVEALASSMEAAFWMAVASAYHCLRLVALHTNRSGRRPLTSPAHERDAVCAGGVSMDWSYSALRPRSCSVSRAPCAD